MHKLKFKYQRTIKKAEFIHADLTYHEEVAKLAKNDFQDAIAILLAKVPPEVREKRETKKPSNSHFEICDNQDIEEAPTNDSFALIPAPDQEETKEVQEAIKKRKKTTELKTLFRRIAEETHPDRVRASGFSEKEVARKTRIFKKAKEAFNTNDWYVLHSIAIDLELPLPNPTDEQIEWMEEDIAAIQQRINLIQDLTAWHWYHGNDLQKKAALNHYFMHVYNFSHPELG